MDSEAEMIFDDLPEDSLPEESLPEDDAPSDDSVDALHAAGPQGAAGVLSSDDFQRIGIQPKETRLAVIRRAATRASQSLASRQLDTPNPTTERQLLRVALSTYRVLDPRQRPNPRQRAHVGRIRPGTLMMAERAAFADGRFLLRHQQQKQRSKRDHVAPHQSAIHAPTAKSQEADTAGAENPSAGRDTRPDVPPIIETRTDRMKVTRSSLRHPATVIGLIVALLFASIGIWFWGQTQFHQNTPSVPHSVRHPTESSFAVQYNPDGKTPQKDFSNESRDGDSRPPDS